jgi:hypothetical protein
MFASSRSHSGSGSASRGLNKRATGAIVRVVAKALSPLGGAGSVVGIRCYIACIVSLVALLEAIISMCRCSGCGTMGAGRLGGVGAGCRGNERSAIVRVVPKTLGILSSAGCMVGIGCRVACIVSLVALLDTLISLSCLGGSRLGRVGASSRRDICSLLVIWVVADALGVVGSASCVVGVRCSVALIASLVTFRKTFVGRGGKRRNGVSGCWVDRR